MAETAGTGTLSGWDFLDKALATLAGAALTVYTTENRNDALDTVAATEASRQQTAAAEAEAARSYVELAGIQVEKQWIYAAAAVAGVALVLYLSKKG